MLLKSDGPITTVLEKGIKEENGLDTLVDLPEMGNVFGEDLAFEIHALFCDHLGPNFRNDVAHGLVDDPGSESPASIYAWWFLLKPVLDDQLLTQGKLGQE